MSDESLEEMYQAMRDGYKTYHWVDDLKEYIEFLQARIRFLEKGIELS